MNAPSPDPALVELAHAHGVATDYHDWKGRHVRVAEGTVRDVLGAMGVDTTDPAAALRRRWEEPWRRMLPACVVSTQGDGRWFWVHVPDGAPVEVWIELEQGGRREHVPQVAHWVPSREVDGSLVGEATFSVPADLPIGYHTVRARSGDAEAAAPLIVTPPRLRLPERLARGHAWGFAAQLYSVRSRESWGVGDLADLTDLSVWSAGLGADYLLVNPLHAAEPAAPMEPSPYLPSSRRFFNPLYLRVERVPEFAGLPAADRARVDGLGRDVHAALDGLDAVDRDTAWTAKREALRLVPTPSPPPPPAASWTCRRSAPRGRGARRRSRTWRRDRESTAWTRACAGASGTSTPPPSPVSSPATEHRVPSVADGLLDGGSSTRGPGRLRRHGARHRARHSPWACTPAAPTRGGSGPPPTGTPWRRSRTRSTGGRLVQPMARPTGWRTV